MNAITNSTSMPLNEGEMVKMAIDECQLGLDMNTARLNRLMDTAFEDPERAKRAFERILIRKGAEHAIGTLQSDGFNGRHAHFGALRGGIIQRSQRQMAKQALNEMPEAILDRKALTDRLSDLRHTHRAVLDRADQERLNRPQEPTRERSR